MEETELEEGDWQPSDSNLKKKGKRKVVLQIWKRVHLHIHTLAIQWVSETQLRILNNRSQ